MSAVVMVGAVLGGVVLLLLIVSRFRRHRDDATRWERATAAADRWVAERADPVPPANPWCRVTPTLNRPPLSVVDSSEAESAPPTDAEPAPPNDKRPRSA